MLTTTITSFSGYCIKLWKHVIIRVLPITLSVWKGVYKNDKTYLSWQTDEGTNFSHFVIEHSTDGVHFSSLGQVAAATSSASTLQYFDPVRKRPFAIS